METRGNGGAPGDHNKLPSTNFEVNRDQTNQANHCAPFVPGETGSSSRDRELYMPSANVMRIMRKILPPHAKIADDAKQTMLECINEFISFVTAEANERCRNEQRKTVTAEDLIWSMSKLGFDDYVRPMSLYLQRYREAEGNDSSSMLWKSLNENLAKRAADQNTSRFPNTSIRGYEVSNFSMVPQDPNFYGSRVARRTAHDPGSYGDERVNGYLQVPSEAGPSSGDGIPVLPQFPG